MNLNKKGKREGNQRELMFGAGKSKSYFNIFSPTWKARGNVGYNIELFPFDYMKNCISLSFPTCRSLSVINLGSFIAQKCAFH